MPDVERAPFELRGASWYKQPLEYETVIYEVDREHHVAHVTLNRPEKMNALSHQLRGELLHALKVAEADNDVNVIVIKGAGRCFSAGYDIGGTMGDDEPDFGSQYVGNSHWPRYLINQWWQIWELSKIVIAQTHGYVLAGGTELCFACDLVITTPDCQFGYPPERAMSAPDLMWFPWLLPKRKAAEMCYTGDSFSGEEVYRLGMVNYSVPANDIDEFTSNFAKRVALIPWQLNSLHKRAFQKAYEFQGIKDAMETNALMWEQYRYTDRVKEMSELRQTMSLREWLTLRDGPYQDYRTAEQAILDRAKREGDAWKGVSQDVNNEAQGDGGQYPR
jgi:enoyl-CoA hydratase